MIYTNAMKNSTDKMSFTASFSFAGTGITLFWEKKSRRLLNALPWKSMRPPRTSSIMTKYRRMAAD